MKQLRKLIVACLVATGLALTLVSSLLAQSADPLSQNIQNKLKARFIGGTLTELPYFVPMVHELMEVCKDTVCFNRFSKQLEREYHPLLSKSVLGIVDKSDLLALNMIYTTVYDSKQISQARSNILKILAPFKKVNFAIDQNLFRRMLDSNNPLFTESMDNYLYNSIKMNLFFLDITLYKSHCMERMTPNHKYFPFGVLADDKEDINFRAKFKLTILNRMIESKDPEFEPSIKFLNQMKLEVRND